MTTEPSRPGVRPSANHELLAANSQQQSFYNNSLTIRQEIQRFESVHPSIYAVYDLLDLVPEPLAQQIREHVVCIEGRTYFQLHTFRQSGRDSKQIALTSGMLLFWRYRGNHFCLP